MKVVVFDPATAEDNFQAPNWWINFNADIVNYNLRDQVKKRNRVAEWHRDVNKKLANYGGQLHKLKAREEYVLTFRLDCNFTYFLLKYEYTPKEPEWIY